MTGHALNNHALNSHAPVRMLRHPGPLPATRWTSVENPGGPSLRLELPAGETLYDALVLPLRARGVVACAINLLDGHFTRGAYCLARPEPDIAQVIAYTAPIMVDRALRLIGAGATLGEDEHGAPLLHCHGLLVDAEGRLIGGHLLTERCVIDEGGCVAYVHALRATRLTRRYDPHIQLAVFQPETKGDIHADH
ncbi:PPC domain-containing DNA-binding protein [Achromobacter aloeverae]|uniref:DUF296 domain-containing protein n=1 Tax=Achromobacter aloeverae TaxID=1750518 RepID=A0A4Q1HRR2_9BURK|nr:DUF296 domain-containing protein [Achromobacter aloeverae]RXN93243.1 DUF296 domain-containing protein [Achromobacter aloeverae]